MEKGIYLIELLTVIAILGIITAITAPTILVLKSSKEQAFIDSAAGVTEAARNLSS
ncbi:MAG: prepilin-type N-terminal cleavage/methylation domain-containing protein [Bacilli bacterium]